MWVSWCSGRPTVVGWWKVGCGAGSIRSGGPGRPSCSLTAASNLLPAAIRKPCCSTSQHAVLWYALLNPSLMCVFTLMGTVEPSVPELPPPPPQASRGSYKWIKAITVMVRSSVLEPTCTFSVCRVSEEPWPLSSEVLLSNDQNPDVHPLHRGVLVRQRQGRQSGLLWRMRGQSECFWIQPLTDFSRFLICQGDYLSTQLP